MQVSAYSEQAATPSPVEIGGASGTIAAFLIFKLVRGEPIGRRAGDDAPLAPRQTIVVAPNTKIADELYNDLTFFLHQHDANAGAPQVSRFTGWEVLPFEQLSPAADVSAERLHTLYLLLSGGSAVVITTPEALMQRIVTPGTFRGTVLQLRVNMTIDRDELITALDRRGYVRNSIVEESGQMAVRGGVVDLFPPGADLPLRIELFGDVVESLRAFDPATQRSLAQIPMFDVLPAREVFLSRDGEDDDSLSRVVGRLRERVTQLELPTRFLEPLEDALRNQLPWPGLEHLQPLLSPTPATLLDYAAPDSVLLVHDQLATAGSVNDFAALIEERAERARREGLLFPEPQTAYADPNSIRDILTTRTSYVLNPFPAADTSDAPSSAAQHDASPLNISFNKDLHQALQLGRYRQLPLKPLADEILARQEDGLAVAFVIDYEPRVRRIIEVLSSYDIHAEESPLTFAEWRDRTRQRRAGRSLVPILRGHINAGIVAPAEGFQLIVDSEVFAEIAPRRRTSAAKSVRRFLGSISQLKENDYIVHVDHGVGIYRGLKQITIEGKVGDYLALEYAEQSKLFVPVDNIGKIQKYIGAEGKQPVLNKLGGKSWEKTKRKIREDIAELAGQLVRLYAEREIAKGVSYGLPDSDDQVFADTFGFEETPDQSRAIDEVLSDLAESKPMDRLVCGDVGYGKTEVALRAAFKAVNSGKQVAVLVPTTILADQHYNTFRERFAQFPFRVGCVSRFFSTQENKATLAALAAGQVDVIIGTHRLLQMDVFFKQLGLLIIDEEHRFGVAHKERLKRFRKEVDVLTLTATPIPRTLHMSLAGIRDLSVIETPPVDRHVIRTYIAPYSSEVVREAILRELSRGGQTFYIHNRVTNIALIRDELAELIPEARIDFAHGQMKEGELEKVMHRFLQKEIDVLVCTTIVESGLDIPNANTIIIRQADQLGLAELYQLRGRVGRSSRRAYAYLLTSDPSRIGPDAKKRLQVLQSLDDLGQGFRLALQDMEIRGAGNLLGKDQSGQITQVGFDLYNRILKEAVEELRAKGLDVAPPPTRPEVDPEIKIGFPAHIPPEYIPDVGERLLLYQRLISLESDAEADEMSREIEDRFGRLPDEVIIVLELMAFRALLRRVAIVSATYRNGVFSFDFHPQALLDRERLLNQIATSQGRIKIAPSMTISARLEDLEVESPRVLHKFMKQLLVKLGIPPEVVNI